MTLTHALGYAALLAAAAVWYVDQTRRGTDVSLEVALRRLPADAVASWDRVTTAAAAAVDDGLAAARAREAELGRALASAGTPPDKG